MYGIDKLKLVMNLDDVIVIQDDKFKKTIQGDELLSLYYHQDYPFMLKIWINYCKCESVVEFTGKVLLGQYHQLIRLSNIRTCIENINNLGIVNIKLNMDSEVVVCDVANDVYVNDVGTLSTFIRGNLKNYNKYTPEVLYNGNLIIRNKAKTKQYRQELTIYDKNRNMSLADNSRFLREYYGGINPFMNMCRFEISLDSKKQIRSSLNINDTNLKSVLLAAQSINPIYNFLDDILEDNFGISCVNELEEYRRLTVLQDNDFDIIKVYNKLKTFCSKKTKMSSVIKPYRKLLEKIETSSGGYTRESVLKLINTTTQVTPSIICEFL